jgi:hypothetical protein
MSAKARPQDTLVFVDAVEAGQARLMLGERAFTVPATLLPADAHEGSWIRLSAAVVPPPPDDAEAARQRLADDDPGGDLKL